jgi:hypothetical protein
MTVRMLVALVALTLGSAGAVMAQDQAQLVAAQAVVLPMMQEIAPGKAGEALTGCVMAAATPQEIAAFAAAGAPSREIGAAITAILARPAATACLSALAGN